MIEIQRIKEKTNEVLAGIGKRNIDATKEIAQIIALEPQRRAAPPRRAPWCLPQRAGRRRRVLALLCLCSAASLARVALGRSASVACLATPLTRLSRVYNSTARALGPLHTPDSAARPAARSTETPEGRPHTNRDPASRPSGSPGYLGLGCRKRAESQHGASATSSGKFKCTGKRVTRR